MSNLNADDSNHRSRIGKSPDPCHTGHWTLAQRPGLPPTCLEPTRLFPPWLRLQTLPTEGGAMSNHLIPR